MPREIPQSELDAICQAVKKLPGGASIDEISGMLDVALPRRTLQRRLARLVQEGRLVSEGAGRGSRYYLPNALAVSSRSQKVMSKERALSVLSRIKPVLEERYGVTGLALFGSTVRNEAEADSDVDILVEFDGPATSKRFFGVQFLLEDEFGHAVDLVSEKALRPELRPYIEREAIHV
jgi:predicted nucleotidyltransferase